MPIHSLLIPFLTLVISTTPAVQEAPVSDKAPQSAAVDPTKMIGKPLPSVQVADLEEKIVDLSKLGEETLVLEFTLPSCSFAKRLYIQKRVQPLIRRWGKSGVKWVSIDSTFFAHPSAGRIGQPNTRWIISSFSIKRGSLPNLWESV